MYQKTSRLFFSPRWIVIGCLFLFAVTSGCSCKKKNFRLKWLMLKAPLPKKLSTWKLFKGKMTNLLPAKGFLPYDLNTPLFSDYASKHRMIWLPPGTKAKYTTFGILEFPVGTIIAKTFSFPTAKNLKGKGIVETRILFRSPKGWKAVPYIWNKEQTDAELRIAGGRQEIVGIKQHPKTFTYVIPNRNECVNCHEKGKQPSAYGPIPKTTPIGPKARNLNKLFTYPDGKTENQLLRMKRIGFLEGVPTKKDGSLFPPCNFVQNKEPSKHNCSPFVPPSNDTKYPLNTRARAYLDNNCAHCHRADGAAGTSGMWLDYLERQSNRLGICKSPAAAGKAARCYRYDVCSGDPDHSILLYRLGSPHSDIMMPELGRSLADCNKNQGVALIREWIKGMKAKCGQSCSVTKVCAPFKRACKANQ